MPPAGMGGACLLPVWMGRASCRCGWGMPPAGVDGACLLPVVNAGTHDLMRAAWHPSFDPLLFPHSCPRPPPPSPQARSTPSFFPTRVFPGGSGQPSRRPHPCQLCPHPVGPHPRQPSPTAAPSDAGQHLGPHGPLPLSRLSG
eukprot:355427-Chlamydomonas_euryale.AAC.1